LSRRTLLRYVLFQLRGWLAITVVVAMLWRFWRAPAWLGAVIVAVWIAKDFALYPFMRAAYEREPWNAPSGRLVGVVGIVTQDLDPAGWVRAQGALWQARVLVGGEVIPRGRRVRVEAMEGLCLVVRPEEARPESAAGS